MSRKHISFSQWEPGDAIDEAHLSSCERCRRQWLLFNFLRFKTASAPRMDAPPFFPSRVARLARSNTVPFWSLLERAARRWTPAFSALVLVAAVLLHQYSKPDPVNGYAEVLLEPELRGDLSLDEVIVSLQESLEEGNILEGQQ
ncbi:MAG: hypothetical protein ACE5JX_19365 [Acidobacteriota bacterium]